MVLIPLLSFAKNNKKDNSNPKYLVGAINITDGKIEFEKTIKTPSMSAKEVYDNMLKWANERFKPEDNLNSRVVFTNKEKGEIVASAEEYIVFSSKALSVDRTRIYYHFFIKVEEGSCTLNMSRIRYWYDENRDGGERFTAEEWITDEMALNKKKTKLAPICGKFRRETIDLKDDLFTSAANSLGQQILQDSNSNQININGGKMTTVNISQLPSDFVSIASEGRITITANDKEINVKPEAWGGFGKLFNKDVSYTIVDKGNNDLSKIMEKCNTYTISFYAKQGGNAFVIIDCKKSMSQNLSADDLKSLNQNLDTSKEYTMYIGEIVKVQMMK